MSSVQGTWTTSDSELEWIWRAVLLHVFPSWHGLKAYDLKVFYILIQTGLEIATLLPKKTILPIE